MTGAIVWINGDFPIVVFLMIFKYYIPAWQKMLDPQERVDVDDGKAAESSRRGFKGNTKQSKSMHSKPSRFIVQCLLVLRYYLA